MHTLTAFYPTSSVLRFGVWSVLLHLGAIAMLGVLHVARPADNPRPLVTVTLLKPPPPVSQDAPPMLHTERPVAPQQFLPAPPRFHPPQSHPVRTTDMSQPPPRPANPVTRKLLLDHHASDTLKLKNFMKAPARPTTPVARTTTVPQDGRHIVIAKPNTTNLWSSHEAPTPAPSTTHTNAQDAPKVFRDATADRKNLLTTVRPIKSDSPPYPYTARKQGWEGTVVLRLAVTREGTVERADIRTSSGFSILDESARQAVQAWRFEPARDGEFAVPTTVELPIRFALDDP